MGIDRVRQSAVGNMVTIFSSFSPAIFFNSIYYNYMVKRSKQIPFGLHLMLDAYNCDPKTLNDQNLVYKILDTLPEKVGMRKLMKPYVLFTEANDKRDP